MAEKAHRDKSISRKVSQALKPFLQGVHQYGQALDVISNSSSMVLCPLWGGIRVMLHLATEFGEYFEKLASMLQQIGLNLRSLRRFPRLYPHNDHLALAMVDVYRKIFEFCSKARRIFVEARERREKKICIPIGLQTMTKLIWKPFKEEFGDINNELLACMERVDLEVDLAEKEEAHLERGRAEDERRAQSFRWEKTLMVHSRFEDFLDEQSIAKINHWLSPANAELNHTAARKLRHSGTGRWFLQSQAFSDWLDHDNGFLWVHAIPGAGKTVLMSSAIEYLKENVCSADVGLAYFYCDYKEVNKQEPSKVLCTLLCQLAMRNKTIFGRLQSFFQDRYNENPSFTPGFDELRGNFSGFLEGSCSQVLLVVDALDECTQRDCIARALKTILDSCPTVKILVSSRQEQEITNLYETLPNLKITQSHMAPDIESFVKAEVAARIKAKRLKIRKPELQAIICDKLVSRADGMFQWVKCQIDVLCTLGMDKLILKALEDLPRDLVGTYSRILERVEREHEQLECVRRLLQWLVKGTRSMTLDELSECIGLDLEEETDAMDFDAVITDPTDILNLCGSLVTLSDDRKVSLAHFTVKEFLMSDETRNSMAQFYVSDDQVESDLAKTCLTYLNFGDFVRGVTSDEDNFHQMLEQYKFLEYAAQSWAVHAERCGERDIEDKIMRLLSSEDEGRGNFSSWTQVYHFSRMSRRFALPTDADPVYYASLFGLPHSLQRLLEDGASFDITDTEHDPLKAAITEGHIETAKVLINHDTEIEPSKLGKYLYIAAAKGHHALVLALLEKGVAVDAQGGKQGTALQIASLEGHREVVQALLKQGASTKVVSARFGTPLSAAAEKGHQGCFQLLLNAGASIHGKGGWYAYPLVSALVGKNDTIIQILLNKGANVNLTGGRHVCPLMAASAVSKTEWVGKLIDAGARVNDENDKGADALHSACCANRLDVVKLLLANGADVNAKGGKHRNALNAASSVGSVDIVKCLLEAGAEASAFDENYGNALQAAVLGNHYDVVELLAPRCDVNARGGVKGSALVIAASYTNVKMIERLFELGVQTGMTSDMAEAMVAASARGNNEVVDVLLAKGSNVNAIGTYRAKRWTPLQIAARSGNIETVDHLLRSSADPNIVAVQPGTALIAAIDTRGADPSKLCIIESLIKAGASVNQLLEIPGGSGPWNTALAAAVGWTNIEAAKILLERGADVNLTHGTCWTTLQVASNRANLQMLELLFEHGADPNLVIQPSFEPGDNGIITALQEAARRGTEDTIHFLVSHGADLILSRDDCHFKSALHAACFFGMIDNVKALLELGSDVNCQGGYWGTALQAAAYSGHVEVINLLLDAGAEINACQTGHYKTALMAACDHINDDRIDAVKALLERGADPSLRAGTQLLYPLQLASWRGSDQIVNALIAAGANVNAFGGRHHSALQAAAISNEPDILIALIEAGAEVDATGGKFGTAFAAAYSEGAFPCTNILYDHGASNKIVAGVFGSPLGAALAGACQTLVTFFIKRHEADPNEYLGKRLGTILHQCIKTRYWDGEGCDVGILLDLLLEAGADVNGLGPDGFGGRWGTPLGCAALTGSTELLRKLLDAGADINLRGGKGKYTALQLACNGEREEVVDFLLENGAEINAEVVQTASARGKTNLIQKFLHRGAEINYFSRFRYGHALQSAVMRGHEEAAKLLVKQGAEINAEGGRFGCALQAAALRCSKKFIKFMIKKGANVHRKGGYYQTALQAAAAAGRTKIVSLLLQHEVDVNVSGGRYGSALQAACVFGNIKTVRKIINHGADVNLRSGFYGTALSAAAIKGRQDIVRYLLANPDLTETTVDRRPDNQSGTVYDKADQLILDIKNAMLTTKDAGTNQEDGTRLEEDHESVVDSEGAEDTENDDWENTGSEDASTHATTASDDASAPSTKDPRPNSKQPEEADSSANAGEDGTEEVLSPLSWLQVECGYGGDLLGAPGERY